MIYKHICIFISLFLVYYLFFTCAASAPAQQARELANTLSRLMRAHRWEDAMHMIHQDAARPALQQLLSIRERQRLLAQIEKNRAQDRFQPDLLQALQKPITREPITLDPVPYETWRDTIVSAAKADSDAPISELSNFFTKLHTAMQSYNQSPITEPRILQNLTLQAVEQPLTDTNKTLRDAVETSLRSLERSYMAHARALIGEVVYYILEHQDAAINVLQKYGINLRTVKHVNAIRPNLEALTNEIPDIPNRVAFLEEIRNQLKKISSSPGSNT